MMTDDDDKRDDSQDPWADLDAGDLPDLTTDFTVSFDDEIAVTPGEADARDEAAEPPASEAAGDSDIDAWLNDPGDEPRPALSVFQEDESPGLTGEGEPSVLDRSEIEIGTGQSGVPSPSSLEMTSDVFAQSGAADMAEAAEAFDFFTDADEEQAEIEPAAGSVVDRPGDALESADAIDTEIAFAETDGGTAPVDVTTATAAAPHAKKKSALGPLLGVLAGGVLAIPITLGILLGVGRDPLGIAGLLPESLAFLTPAPSAPPQPVVPVEPGAGMAASTPVPLATVDVAGDDLEADSEPAVAEPEEAAEPAGVAADSADGAAASLAVDAMMDGSEAGELATDPAQDHALEPGGEPVMDDVADRAVDPVLDQALEPAVDPIMETPAIEPDAAALLASLEPAPAIDAVAAPAAPAEPAFDPLDLTLVEANAADAVARTAEVAGIDDLSNPDRRRELAAWYRTLAAYADSLAAVDRAALETGRGLADAEASISEVQREIAAHPAVHPSLARLTRDWVDFERRANDGVVMPARFQGSRPVGPWWRSEVLVGDSEGRPDRLFVVMTRAEPMVATDAPVLVTGLALDDGVIWASDLRPAASGAAEQGP